VFVFVEKGADVLQKPAREKLSNFPPGLVQNLRGP
jgi:hypothetical protein